MGTSVRLSLLNKWSCEQVQPQVLWPFDRQRIRVVSVCKNSMFHTKLKIKRFCTRLARKPCNFYFSCYWRQTSIKNGLTCACNWENPKHHTCRWHKIKFFNSKKITILLGFEPRLSSKHKAALPRSRLLYALISGKFSVHVTLQIARFAHRAFLLYCNIDPNVPTFLEISCLEANMSNFMTYTWNQEKQKADTCRCHKVWFLDAETPKKKKNPAGNRTQNPQLSLPLGYQCKLSSCFLESFMFDFLQYYGWRVANTVSQFTSENFVTFCEINWECENLKFQNCAACRRL